MNIANHKSFLRISSIIMAASGLVILFSVFWPIVSYENVSSQDYRSFITPIVETQNENTSTIGTEIDYTKASNWFVGAASKDVFSATNVSYYTISIPKLKIENATVAIGGEELSEHLIQYPGTALPGKAGNAVIFGHSVLPIFYNPKNYLSIFSLLPTLKEGDEIIVSYDGITYKYEIESMFEVSPTDIQVLDQNKSDSFITLVTCVPPGDPRKSRRLIVRARVVPLTQKNENNMQLAWQF